MYQFTRYGRFQGIAAGYYDQGCVDLTTPVDVSAVIAFYGPAELRDLSGYSAPSAGARWKTVTSRSFPRSP